MKKLCVFLLDPLKVYYKKGEIKKRYYNPSNFFDEVHFISFCKKDIDEKLVQKLVGSASLKIHAMGKISLLTLFSLTKKLTKLLKKLKPDVIRAYDPSIRGAMAVYIGKKINLPTIISVHNHFDEQRKFDGRFIWKIRKLLEHYSLRNADKVICIANYVKSYVQKYRAKDITTVYNKVHNKQFENPGQKSENKKKTILSIGRLDRQKKHECLIKAIKELDARLILIGDGKLRSHLLNLSKKLRIEDKINFVNSVPNDRIQQYYFQADIFAIATNYEGFCIPVLEAMAASLPVVASRIGPIVELLGDNRFLVENNPDAFKKALKELLENPLLRKEIGKANKQKAILIDGELMEQKEAQVYGQTSAWGID